MFTPEQIKALEDAIDIAYEGTPSDDAARSTAEGEARKALQLMKEGNALVFNNKQLSILYQGMTGAVATAIGVENITTGLLLTLMGIALADPEVQIKEMMRTLQRAGQKDMDNDCGNPFCPVHGKGEAFDTFVIDIEPRRTRTNRTWQSDLHEDR